MGNAARFMAVVLRIFVCYNDTDTIKLGRRRKKEDKGDVNRRVISGVKVTMEEKTKKERKSCVCGAAATMLKVPRTGKEEGGREGGGHVWGRGMSDLVLGFRGHASTLHFRPLQL